MTTSDLHQQLREAYSTKNLNAISLTLINLYKAKQFSTLGKIAEMISDYVDIEVAEDGKGFSKLMMLYHPDRAVFHLNKIDLLAELNDLDGLLEYSHILKLERIEEIAASLERSEDLDYSPVYDWDMNTEGFRIVNIREPSKDTHTRKIATDFYNAIKIREYGHTDIEFPAYYLEDIDEFEMSARNINDLDGVQFCIHAVTIDVSDNQITDLSPLSGLNRLENLNLSDNKIGDIDVLSTLTNLTTIQLANNFINDISPLFELEKLGYVDLSGNKIGLEQINQLIQSGVEVEF